MSNTSPFTTGLIADAIGPYGDDDVVDNILNGTSTRATLGLIPDEGNKEVDTSLQSLQHTTTPYGAPINDMDNTITLDEYKQLFTKTKEKNSLVTIQTTYGSLYCIMRT